MGFNCGIVGLPNVGKSTIFNALTAAGAQAANFPFCTIEPNVGVVPVPDGRLERIAEFIPTQKIVHASMEFVDIAGLVRGAASGEGLGNQFLGHIRAVDAIAHVVRCFDDPNVVHVAGKVDPLDDITVINLELILADLQAVDKSLQKNEKAAQTAADKNAKALVAALKKVKAGLEAEKPARLVDLTDEEREVLAQLQLITAKPVLYVCNVDEAHAAHGSDLTKKVEELAAKEGAKAVVLSGKIEAEVQELPHEERLEFLRSMGLEEPGLNRLIRAGYDLLHLRTYFTAGPKEVRAWTIHAGNTAPQAAGVIHTDFEKGFIRANVYHFDDLMKHHTENAVKEAGRMRSEGKEYVMQDGDICHFLFNV